MNEGQLHGKKKLKLKKNPPLLASSVHDVSDRRIPDFATAYILLSCR